MSEHMQCLRRHKPICAIVQFIDSINVLVNKNTIISCAIVGKHTEVHTMHWYHSRIIHGYRSPKKIAVFRHTTLALSPRLNHQSPIIVTGVQIEHVQNMFPTCGEILAYCKKWKMGKAWERG